MHHKALWPLTKRASRGFRGHPIATIAFYGPDDRRASKVAVGLISAEGKPVSVLERWTLENGDVRDDAETVRAVQEFVDKHSPRSVAMSDRIIGCPHEEGIDYPLDEPCPRCPFWKDRDRWSGSR
jgi:hypothetical protein